jgi:maltose-binding protein MalE
MLEKIKSVFSGKTLDEKRHKRLSLIFMGLLFLVILSSGLVMGSRYRQQEAKREAQAGMGDMLVWYTNDALTPYMEYVAEDYEKQTGMHVVAKKVSPADYLEQIYSASISEESTTPDVYITTNNCLEQAYLSGVATEQYLTLSEQEFSESALHAVTYKGKKIASPLYFDTTLLFYNKQYAGTPPETMDALLAFAESFEEAEGVENILKWNCADGFRDYFFIGSYLDVAGTDGDDGSILEAAGENLIQAMEYFQSMNDYFSIDIDSVTEASVLSEFIEGKTVFVLGDTSYISVLAQSGMTDYGVAKLPMLSEALDSRDIAVTDVAVVNGFSKKQEAAAKFVHALTVEYASYLYELTEKIPACTTVQFSEEGCQVAQEQYADSRQLPKLMNLGDYWVQLEMMMTDVWKGEDAAGRLETFRQQLESRLTAE